MPQKYISPWPKADEQRRRAATAGRSTWQKPEPVKPISKKYYVFGIEVPLSTFKKYDHQNYTIGACFFSLASVERWATDPEIAARFPKQAAEARQIMEQIISEITGKELEQMKTPKTAADYISALNDIYQESRSSYDTLHKKVDAAKVKMNCAYDDMRDPAYPNRQMAEALYAVAKGEHQLAEEECRIEYNKLMDTHRTRVDELRTKFAAYLDDYYAASPDKLDAATMQLLNSGICTASDLARLAERYTDNPTMLRIVGSHAASKMQEDKHLSREDRVTCAVVKNKASSADGGTEMTLFEEAVAVANYGLGKDYAHATNMHNVIVADALEGYRQRLDGSNAGTAKE